MSRIFWKNVTNTGQNPVGHAEGKKAYALWKIICAMQQPSYYLVEKVPCITTQCDCGMNSYLLANKGLYLPWED